MSIKAIFYSKFDPTHGPKIIHQVPEHSILTVSNTDSSSSASYGQLATSALVSFPNVSRFLIPRQSLCGNFISLSPPPLTPQSPPCLILSYPVCLTSSHYTRNEFIFNFSFVLAHPSVTDVDVASYKSVVIKLAQLMRTLEEQSHFLSNDGSAPNSGPIYSLCEMLMEDLNNYCECMIPIDELNTLNIKLFPTLPDPPRIQAWHVPLFTVRIETLVDENWDLTMQRIIPFVDGVNSVKRIAALADADLKLTRKCVRHLVYYGCVILLDIFSFNAIYAPTSLFGQTIVRDDAMQRECARYVNVKYTESREEAVAFDDKRGGQEEDIWPLTAKGQAIDGVTIVQLFANLRQGLTVREWYAMNSTLLVNVDVRRFITFGVIKGFLYRVHRYAIKTGKGRAYGGVAAAERAIRPSRSMSSEVHLTESYRAAESKKEKNDGRAATGGGRDITSLLLPYLDGTHCFDEICTNLEISERDLMVRLSNWRELGEVVTICR
ncbi:hypothetical protein DV735_g4982, partial [Chaetothyriales sp. CBS 134920]